ncbi:MAG: class I SAM-dependent methyltransferase [Acidimicrobiales bacterium]
MSTWADHIPFAYDLIEALRPRLLVELGTHHGLSFFAFCQGMKEHRVNGVCFAVDTWEGDVHTGDYDDSVFLSVQSHLREEYRGFSYMIRSLFSAAAERFSAESIELLHIDGLHTYAAVKEDFETWYPKVKPGGIILFHDVNARLDDFGVWKFWEETSAQHETFTFDHGFGLGVLRKPGGDRGNDGELLNLLFSDEPKTIARLRELYVFIGELILHRPVARMHTRRHEEHQAEKLLAAQSDVG